jgi:hypothetical protein
MRDPEKKQAGESQEDFVRRISKFPILHPDTILRAVFPTGRQANLQHIKDWARPVFPEAFPQTDWTDDMPISLYKPINPENISTKAFAKWVVEENIFEAWIELREEVSPSAKLFIELVHGKTDNPAKPKAKKGRYAKQKRAVRKIARKLWKQDKNYTIASLTNDKEIKKNKKPDGTNFSEDTLRNWIKDLAPTNKPGRRKNK